MANKGFIRIPGFPSLKKVVTGILSGGVDPSYTNIVHQFIIEMYLCIYLTLQTMAALTGYSTLISGNIAFWGGVGCPILMIASD